MEGTTDRSLAVDIGVKAVRMGERMSGRDKVRYSSPRLGGDHLELLRERRIEMHPSPHNFRFQEIEDVLNRFYGYQRLCRLSDLLLTREGERLQPVFSGTHVGWLNAWGLVSWTFHFTRDTLDGVPIPVAL